MRRYGYVFLIIAILLSCICSGCSGETAQLPEYDRLTGLIGHSKAEVFHALQLNESELTHDGPITYYLPQRVEYCGISFQIFLHFDTDKDALYGFWYTAYYENTPEQFSADAVKTYTALSKKLPEPVRDDLSAMTQEAYTGKFSESLQFSNDCVWNLTKNLTDRGQAYLEHFNTLAYEPGSYALTLEASIDPAAQVGVLYIRSQIVDGYKLSA